MSTRRPGLEARVGAQERQMTMLHARIEELSQDMDTSFRQLAAYQVATERKIDVRFDEVRAQITDMEGRILDAFQQLIALIDTRFPSQ
jgi:outer membrane PBP1 activator LpoA protein